MAEVPCMPIFSSHENIEALLVKVESRMQCALHLDADWLVRDQESAHHAAAYHLQSGGRRVRARLALAAGSSLGLSDEDCVCIASCVELLHNASLVHDDLQDGDIARRGQAAVWSKYGSNLAICTGDLLLSAAYGILSSFSQALLLPPMMALLHERTATTISGQCADLASLSGQVNVISSYVRIAIAKSGALLSLPLELALLAANRPELSGFARKACENLAVSYQILDDLQDFTMENPTGEDGDAPAMSLNIVSVICNFKGLSPEATPADAVASARALALSHLEHCDSGARELPGTITELLLTLSADLRRLIDVHACKETC
jgi:geranylgeranyl pyrophosphate synthase